jgi:ATP synthase protein I
MASDANRPDKRTGSEPSERELSDRLRRLGERLGPARADTDQGGGGGTGGGDGDPGGLGKAMRLSTEFVAGVIAGALLGWVVDRLLGTSPWGLIVLLLLGFGAGVVNVMRAAGMWSGRPSGTNRS